MFKNKNGLKPWDIKFSYHQSQFMCNPLALGRVKLVPSYDIHALIKQVMKILEIIRYKLLPWSNTKSFSIIYKEMCSSYREESRIKGLTVLCGSILKCQWDFQYLPWLKSPLPFANIFYCSKRLFEVYFHGLKVYTDNWVYRVRQPLYCSKMWWS